MKLRQELPLDFPITAGDWQAEILLWKREGRNPPISWDRWLNLRDIGRDWRRWKAHQNGLSRAQDAPRTRPDAQRATTGTKQ